MKIDLNCDLGEGEPAARTRALMRWVTSANVACGGHAGEAESMDLCVRLARQFGVLVGAHPGSWARGDFGRNALCITPDELELLLLHQVGALERIARSRKVRLHHIKLHGALYHASEADDKFARRYLRCVARWWPGVVVYAKANGRVASLAKRAGVKVWEEGFADRGYLENGALVPRDQPGALVTDIPSVLRRVRGMLGDRQIEAISGVRLHLRPQTICIHSDTPNAPAIARTVRRLLVD